MIHVNLLLNSYVPNPIFLSPFSSHFHSPRWHDNFSAWCFPILPHTPYLPTRTQFKLPTTGSRLCPSSFSASTWTFRNVSRISAAVPSILPCRPDPTTHAPSGAALACRDASLYTTNPPAYAPFSWTYALCRSAGPDSLRDVLPTQKLLHTAEGPLWPNGSHGQCLVIWNSKIFH